MNNGLHSWSYGQALSIRYRVPSIHSWASLELWHFNLYTHDQSRANILMLVTVSVEIYFSSGQLLNNSWIFFFISSRSSIVIVTTPTMLSNRCTFRFMNKDYGCCRCYKAMPHSSNLYLQFMNQHHYFSFDNKIWCKLLCNKDHAKLASFT